MALKIFGWASDHNGCGHYRIGLPMWALAQLGHDATAFSLLNVALPDDLDILVGQLIVNAEQSAYWQHLAGMNDRGFAMVYEIDDDIWNVVASNPAAAYYDDVARQRAIDNIKVADAVTVTTAQLAEVVGRFNPNVFVLPNCIDAALLAHQRPRADLLTLGWAGGSSHREDFASVSKDLRSFFRKNPELSTHFIGVNFGHLVGRPQTRFTRWSSNLIDYLKGLDFDLGIAPLAANAFNRSKSDLKFLEYSAVGIPIVASDVGPYHDSVEHGVTGFLAKFPHEWSKYLNLLVKDDDLRIEIGDNARSWAESRTIQSNIWRWDFIYSALVGKAALSGLDTAVSV